MTDRRPAVIRSDGFELLDVFGDSGCGDGGYRNGMRVRAELTTEPFEGEGELPGHVRAAADAMLAVGLEPYLGPLGTTVQGESEVVTLAIQQAARAALAAGATRVSLQLERLDA